MGRWLCLKPCNVYDSEVKVEMAEMLKTEVMRTEVEIEEEMTRYRSQR